MRRLFALAGMLTLAGVVLFFFRSSPNVQVQAAPTGLFGVSGFLTASASVPGAVALPVKPIYVPGVRVTLTNLLTGVITGPIRTDLSGRYTFPPREPGRYRVCWTGTGFVNGCTSIFNISNKHLHLGDRSMTIAMVLGAKTFFGQVHLADGSLARSFEPNANVNAFGDVRVIDTPTSRPRRVAYVNNLGEYIAPAVAVSGVFTLQAHVENVTKSFNLNAAALGSTVHKDFVLNNRPPEIRGLIGNSPAGKHWTAASGEFVNVTAQAVDPDGDALSYRWILPDGSSTLANATGQTIGYQLPDHPGRYEFTAIAYDGKGGYAKESIPIYTEGVRFAGTVLATDAPAVPGAEVEINGATILTDGDGYFRITVPESTRYVLNIRKLGYGLVSRVYDNGLTAGRWVLTRATVKVFNPGDDIDATDTRDPHECRGSLSERRRRQGKPPTQCGPGFRVKVPANSLVDEQGNLPTTPITVYTTTNDVQAPDGMQGDWGATDTGGTLRIMETYGAGTAEFWANGKKLNLRPGALADAIMPITPQQLAAPGPLPAQIPLLDYDEKAGTWRQEGVANRIGNFYVGKVKHFSAKNMDQLKQGQSCVRLETTLMPASFDLEITLPGSGGSAPTVRTETITNETQRFHTLFNLAGGEIIELRPFEQGTSTPIKLLQPPPDPPTEVLFVNTGGIQNPSTPNEPEFPYEACQTSVELTPARLPPATANMFLAGLGSFEAANLTELSAGNTGADGPFLAASEAYYNTIDPKGFRRDLTDFKAKNGFPNNEINAQYVNVADLGFGRDMHCRKSGLDVACYVTNYGDRYTKDLDDLLSIGDPTLAVATVGMEYSRIEDPAGDGSTFITGPGGAALRVVKFYVFKEALASPVNPGEFNGRAPSANLDNLGERPVPQLCMVCHGGRLPAEVFENGGNGETPAWNLADPKSANLGSAFIPFDVSGFFMSDSQEGDIKLLNQNIVLATEPPAATEEVIDAMYAGNVNVQHQFFPIAGWTGTAEEQEVYARVVGPSCRSCHISQGPTDIAWDTAAGFLGRKESIAFRVCQTNEMPHALVTHNRFWLSTGPHQPLKLHDFLNGADPPETGLGKECVIEVP